MKYVLSVPWPFLRGKMCVQGVWRDSLSSFLIYMLLCFQFRDGKVKEILLPLHKCVFEASGNSGEREPNRACTRKGIIKCGFFLHQFIVYFLLRLSGSSHQRKIRLKPQPVAFFPSSPCCFHFTWNLLCFYLAIPTWAGPPPPVPANLKLQHTGNVAQPRVPLPRAPAGCNPTPERKIRGFSHGIIWMNLT